MDARTTGERIFEGGFFFMRERVDSGGRPDYDLHLYQGVPALSQIGVFKFIFGTVWKPTSMQFGLAPMIVTSLITAVISAVIGSIIGILTACYMTDLAGKRGQRILRPCIDLLAGIPSGGIRVFRAGIAGAVYPLLHRRATDFRCWRPSSSLSIMILPTVITITMDAINAVPHEYREGALALGNTDAYAVFRGAAGRQKDHLGRRGAGYGPRHWRDDGGDAGIRQPADNAWLCTGPHPHDDKATSRWK